MVNATLYLLESLINRTLLSASPPDDSDHGDASSPLLLPEQHDPDPDDPVLSPSDLDAIRPYIDEEELAGMDPKARLHIIVSALACNLETTAGSSTTSPPSLDPDDLEPDHPGLTHNGQFLVLNS